MSGEGARLPVVAPTPVAAGVSEPEAWPRGISRRATMRISDALAALRIEFPAMTPSRLRFLEDQGLVHPVRTPAGYRQYSPADIERLRYVLRQQRDHYRPLRVIAEQLAALDAGQAEEAAPRARLATRDGAAADPRAWTVAALARDAGVAESFVTELVDAGVLRPGPRGVLEAWDRDVVLAAARLAEHGVDARHLRSLRSAADRQVDLVEALVAPVRGRRGSSAPERAGTLAAELGELLAQMHTSLLRAAVAQIVP